MFKEKLGMIMAILGAIGMCINISFFNVLEWYDTVRVIFLTIFIIGVLLVPVYSHSSSKEK